MSNVVKRVVIFVYICLTAWGDGVAQLVQRQTRDPKNPRFEPRQEHKKKL